MANSNADEDELRVIFVFGARVHGTLSIAMKKIIFITITMINTTPTTNNASVFFFYTMAKLLYSIR